MKKLGTILSVLIGCAAIQTESFAWNSVGHRLIGQIAYDHLQPTVKKTCNYYNHGLDHHYPVVSFPNAAPWLDTLRDDYPELSEQHYIDIPLSQDRTPVVYPKEKNALYAIKAATVVMQDARASRFEKGFALRKLIHIVGDLHQPLHAISVFSQKNPHGDAGGNYHLLGPNEVASNLHAYWDKGGGLFMRKKPTSAQLREFARSIEKHWPCDFTKMDNYPAYWAVESFLIALNSAYSIKMHATPTQEYKERVQYESEKRIALAGCRLAFLLNNMPINQSES